MKRSDEKYLIGKWHRLVLNFKIAYLCGENGETINSLEDMFDFAQKNKRNMPEDCFLRIVDIVPQLYDFVSGDNISKLATKAIYSRYFLLWLLK